LAGEKNNIIQELKKYKSQDRYSIKLHKNIAFYLVEKDKFTELYENRKNIFFDPAEEIKPIPKEIADKLDLCKNKNVDECIKIFNIWFDNIINKDIVNTFTFKN